ncbi:MAG: hypothetical protein NZZ41_07940, partial [Candidatus Dojkabacteria bacterium]|nr:hypothetical protein [Candidatus Dojkabacteria bacterium]
MEIPKLEMPCTETEKRPNYLEMTIENIVQHPSLFIRILHLLGCIGKLGEIRIRGNDDDTTTTQTTEKIDVYPVTKISDSDHMFENREIGIRFIQELYKKLFPTESEYPSVRDMIYRILKCVKCFTANSGFWTERMLHYICTNYILENKIKCQIYSMQIISLADLFSMFPFDKLIGILRVISSYRQRLFGEAFKMLKEIIKNNKTEETIDNSTVECLAREIIDMLSRQGMNMANVDLSPLIIQELKSGISLLREIYPNSNPNCISPSPYMLETRIILGPWIQAGIATKCTFIGEEASIKSLGSNNAIVIEIPEGEIKIVVAISIVGKREP